MSTIEEYKKIKTIKSRYTNRIKELQDEIDGCRLNIERDEIMNREFGQKEWEVELDKIYNHDKEIIKLNTNRIEELKKEEQEAICKALGTS